MTKSESYRLTPYFLLIPIFLFFIDALFYDTRISVYHWVAFFLACFGAFILNLASAPSAGSKLTSPGVTIIISITLLTMSTFLMDKMSDTKDTRRFVMLQSFGFFSTTLLYSFYKPWRHEIVRSFKSISVAKLRIFALNDAAALSGNWVFAAAVAIAPSASYVSLALGVQPFYVMGIIFL